MHRLNDEQHQHIHLVFAIYAIAGVYDLNELYTTKSANANNLLQLNEKSARDLSPMFFNLSKWAHPQRILIAVGEFDSPRFIQQSMEFHRHVNDCCRATVDFELIDNCDHFDIVNNLANDSFVLTRMIVVNAFEESRED